MGRNDGIGWVAIITLITLLAVCLCGRGALAQDSIALTFSYSTADEKDLTKWTFARAEDSRPSSIDSTSSSDGTGTVTTLYFNGDDQLLHKTVEDYVSGTATPVRTARWHWEYNAVGRVLKEITPEAITGVTVNADGTFAVTTSATAGLIKTYTYAYGVHLDGEFVQQGSGGTPIKIAGYEYWQSRDSTQANYLANARPDLVRYVHRYPASGVTETTEYLYPDGFHNNDGRFPRTKVTRVYLDAGETEFLETSEHYNDDNTVAFSKDAGGSVTFYQYYATTDASTGAIEREVQYEVRDIDTSSPPTGVSLPASFPARFATTGGLNLVTAYTYDTVTGETKTIRNPAGEETHYLEILWTASNDPNGTRRTFAKPGDPSLTAVYERVRERRVYPLHHNGTAYEVTGPVEVSFSIDQGDVLSTQLAAATLASAASGPSESDTLKVVGRADEVYSKGGSRIRSRVYHTYDANGAVDTAAGYHETAYAYDFQGRIKSVTDPAARKTNYTYGFLAIGTDYFGQERVYPHDKASGPIQVALSDAQGRAARSFTASTNAADWAGNAPTGTESLDAEHSRTTFGYDWRGRRETVRRWFDLTGLTLADVGVKDTNYYEEQVLAFDELGRTLRSRDGMGNVAATVYDLAGRAIERWQGTDDTGATRSDPGAGSSNLVKVSESVFDDTSRDSDGDNTPDGWRWNRLAQALALKPLATLAGTSADYTSVSFEYDSAGRRTWTKPAVGPWTEQVLDALGRAEQVRTYANGTATLLARTSTTYGAGGDVESSRVYEVTAGTPGNALETRYAYDDAGRQFKVFDATGGIQVTEYDAAGRTTRTRLVSNDGDTDAATDDLVVTQAEYEYDAAGNVIQTTTYARKHDAGTTTGLLTTATARVSYAASWYDDGNRTTHVADYGTHGGASFARPSTPPEPNLSDDVMVAKYVYDEAGRQRDMIDNKGILTRRTYDALGRVTQLVENYVDGIAGDADDRTTLYTYNADGQVIYQTAVMPGATTDQTTSYVYSQHLTDKGGPVPGNSYLRATLYPDTDDELASGALTDGPDAAYDRVEMTYLADGSLATRKDQRGTVLSFAYDAAGRRTSQQVTALGGDTDAAVRSVTYAYDDLGRLAKLTTHGNLTGDASDTTDVVNQLTYAYDGLGQLVTEQQDLDSEVNATGGWATQAISYAYAYDATGGVFTKGGRLAYTTYPDGREIHHVYDGHDGIDDAISRPSALADGSSGTAGTHIVDYRFLGDGRVASKSYPTPGIELDYTGSAIAGSGGYDGYDRFGRITRQHWANVSDPLNPQDVFDVDYGYDRAANRTHAQSRTHGSASQSYAYDNLHRLGIFKQGMQTSPTNGVEDYWITRKQDWVLDALGNQKEVDEDFRSDWYLTSFNDANEIDQRLARGRPSKYANYAYTNGAAQAALFDSVGTGDVFDVNTTNAGWLTVTHLAQDTVGGTVEPEAQALLLYGGAIGPAQPVVRVKFPSDVTSGHAGLIFGYKSPTDYWIDVYEAAGGRSLYRVDANGKQLMATSTSTLAPGAEAWLYTTSKRRWSGMTDYTFADGYPSGRVGLYTNIDDVQFQRLFVYNDANQTDLAGRWLNYLPQFFNHKPEIVTDNGSHELHLHASAEGRYSPIFLKGVRAERFEVTFSARLLSTAPDATVPFAFNGHDQDDYDLVHIVLDDAASPPVPYGLVFDDGRAPVAPSGTPTTATPPSTPQGGVTWWRVTCDGTTVTVKGATTEAGLDSAGTCYSSDGFDNVGGMIGFLGHWRQPRVDNVTVKTDRDANGSYETTEHVETFDVDANGYASESFDYDAAGNLTYDGIYRYGYDAWNRLASVTKAYRDATTGTLQLGSIVAEMEYDGRGRRTLKRVKNSAGLDATLGYYHDGQRIVETRSGSDWLLKQHVWGLTYVDELIQVGIVDWFAAGADNRYWAATDANYNVLGVIDYWGDLVERYEYTPYGQRQVFVSAGSSVSMDFAPSGAGQTRYLSGANDPGLNAPVQLSRRAVGIDYGTLPVGLCEVGHQGLFHDEHTGLVYNRARHLHPTAGRFVQRDPMGYVDGMGSYEYVRGNPAIHTDPAGLKTVEIKFAAFIPLSKGTDVVDAPLKDVKWSAQPGSYEWFFATDNREHPGQEGTSRLFTVITFDSEKIGRLRKGDVAVDVDSDPTYRIKVDRFLYDSDGNPYRPKQDVYYKYVLDTLEWDTADNSQTTKAWNFWRRSEIQHTASGKYPFGPPSALVPAIDYKFTVVSICNTKGDFVRVFGSHDAFPAYELLVNGKPVYGSYPWWDGPGYMSLGIFYNNFNTLDSPGWIKVD